MNKRKNKLAALGSVVCIALAVLVSPASALPVQAAVSPNPVIMPMRDALEWYYKIVNKKIYKRLYNHSTASWVGDWIYIRDLP